LADSAGTLSGAFARIAVALDGRIIDGLANGTGILSGLLARIAVALDGSVIDGLVHGIASAFVALGKWVRRMQTGLLPDYLWNAFMVILLLVAVLVMFRRF